MHLRSAGYSTSSSLQTLQALGGLLGETLLSRQDAIDRFRVQVQKKHYFFHVDYGQATGICDQNNSNTDNDIEATIVRKRDLNRNRKSQNLEATISSLVEQSSVAAEQDQPELALGLAKRSLEALDSLRPVVLQEQRYISSGSEQQQHHYNEDLEADFAATQPMTTSVNQLDLSIMVKSNLAGQLMNCGQLNESLEIYTQLCKLASNQMMNQDVGGSTSSMSLSSPFQSSHQQELQPGSRYLLYRFGLQIGNVLHEMGELQKALKYYRLTLDRLSTIDGCRSLRIKLQNNIALALVGMSNNGGNRQSIEPITALEILLADNQVRLQSKQLVQSAGHHGPSKSASEQATGQITSLVDVYNANHHKFALNLMACHHLRSDVSAMKLLFRSMLQVGPSSHYRRAVDLEATQRRLAKRGAGIEETATSTKKRRQAKTPKQKQQSISGQRPSTATSLASFDETFDSDSMDQVENSGAVIGSISKTIETWPIVSAATRDDHLELVINHKEADIQRALILACNLMLDLERQQQQQQQQQHSDSSNIYAYCLKLFQSSCPLYRGLANELQMDRGIKMLSTKRNLEDAVQLLTNQAAALSEQQHSQTTSNPVETTTSLKTGQTNARSNLINPSSPVVATNLILLNYLWNRTERAISLASKIVRGASTIDLSSRLDASGCWMNLGCCYYMLDQMKQAEACFEQSYRIVCDENDPGRDQKLLSLLASYNLVLVARKRGLHFDELAEPVRLQLQTRGKQLLPMNHELLTTFQYSLLYEQSGMQTQVRALHSDLMSRFKQQQQLAPELYLHLSRSYSSIDDNQEATGPKTAAPTTIVELTDSTGGSYAKIIARDGPIGLLQLGARFHAYHLPLAERLIALQIQEFNYQAATERIFECIRNRRDQVKWYQMMAECHRRAADYKQAIVIYKLASDLFPADTSCLKALVKLTNELGLHEDSARFQDRLNRTLKRLQGIQNATG